MDNELQTDVVFMDNTKAFNTVDHSKMLQKLREYDFAGLFMVFWVTIHGATSQSLPITSDVPQESLLRACLYDPT